MTRPSYPRLLAWTCALTLAFASQLTTGCHQQSASVATTESPPAQPVPDATPPAKMPNPRPEGVIYRDELARVAAAGPAVLLRNLGPEPVRHNGGFFGWRITRVFPEFADLCREGCDLEVGDVIVSVNGDQLETPDAFAAMFARIPDLNVLEIVRIRDGQRSTAVYTISER